MNICQVMISIGWGGAESSVYELVRRLRDKGENVSLIVNQETVEYYADLKNVSLFNIGTLYPPKSIIPHIRTGRIKPDLLRRALLLFYIYLDEVLRYRYYKRVRKKVVQFLSLNQTEV